MEVSSNKIKEQGWNDFFLEKIFIHQEIQN